MYNIRTLTNPIALYQPKPHILSRDTAAHLDNALKVLENYQIFHALSDLERSNVFKHIKIRRYHHHQMIYSQNAPCNEVSIVLQGALKLGWDTPSGRYYTDIIVPTGTIINVVPVINQQPYTHDHTAVGSTILANLNADFFKQLIEKNPAVMSVVLKLVCLRTQMNWERIVYRTTASLRTRLAKELVFLVDFHSYQKKDKFFLNLKLNQENFAELMQTTRQSINKELAKLAQERLIEVKYNQTNILDYVALKKIAESENLRFSTQFR
jgi:CRP/FNR family cyclic AMP-dependent transcriptional regulator